MTEEIWKPVAVEDIEEGYHVSTMGRVMSDIRSYHKILKGKPSKTSGYVVALLKRKSGKKSQTRVHRLVLGTFVGEPPRDKTSIDHINGNKADNRLENLEYVDHQTNIKRAVANGRFKNHGIKNGKIPSEVVLQIRKKERGYLKKFSKLLNVTTITIWNAANGLTYRRI